MASASSSAPQYEQEPLWATLTSLPAVQSDIYSKHKLGDYELLRSLGKGEFARVQSCRRSTDEKPSDDEPVLAVKHISKKRLMRTSNYKRTLLGVRRIDLEIRAMRLISSLYTCQLFDVIHSPDHVHLIMENGGCDLYYLIGEGVDLSAVRTIALFLARGLAAVQAQGVVHRDVKPENVLVRGRRRADNSMVVEALKLCDFGLCAITPIVQRDADATDKAPVVRNWMLSEFVGSPGFLAPEVVTNHHYYDGSAVDAFSLGCILLELVLDNKVFDSVWMAAFSRESMFDRAEHLFEDNVLLALDTLRLMPDFVDDGMSYPKSASEVRVWDDTMGDARDAHKGGTMIGRWAISSSSGESSAYRVGEEKEGRFDCCDSTALSDLLFGLLEISPERRTTLNAAVCHPWLAAVPADADSPKVRHAARPLEVVQRRDSGDTKSEEQAWHHQATGRATARVSGSGSGHYHGGLSDADEEVDGVRNPVW